MSGEIELRHGTPAGMSLTPMPGAQIETAATSAAAQAQAAVQARYLVALHRPRNYDEVRLGLLKECKRTSFANVALYRKPIGRGIEGPSIRFAEAAVRCMTNLLVETPTIYDDDQKRIVRVTAMDLESNSTYSRDVTVNKTVERRKLKEGQKAISQRVNSYGDLTYTVAATDDDILNKENALVSKAIRTCVLRLVPGDIIDECVDQIKATMAAGMAQDPDGQRKKIASGFADLNVKVKDIEAYLGCALDEATPQQLTKLQALYVAMRDGEITIADLREAIGVSSDKKKDKKPSKLEEVLGKKAQALKGKKEKKQTGAEPHKGNPSEPTQEELDELRNEPPK
jgi:hypothetical protein